MIILAGPHPRLRIRMRLAEARDIDEEAVARVDPARVDDVHAVAALALPDPRIDVEDVFAWRGAAAVAAALGGGDVGVGGLVVGGAEVVQRCA